MIFVERKNRTRFASEMRDAFEHLLNFVATESDSDFDEFMKSIKAAESYSYPTHYEKALMKALYTAFADLHIVSEYDIKGDYK